MTKLADRLSRLPALIEQARAANDPATGTAVADFERALNRIVKRAAVPAGMQRVEFAQHHGPTIEFTGTMLAEQRFSSQSGIVSLELWQSEQGAYIAAVIVAGEREKVRAAVIPAQADHTAMQRAVLDHFNWSARALSMVRKLGWSLRQEVE